jgi:hypothetical protein
MASPTIPNAGPATRWTSWSWRSRTGGLAGVLSLGEVKWGDVMGEGHVERLRRVRDLLAGRGYDMRATRLACYSAAGFTADLLAAENDEVMLVTPDRLYS